MRGSIATQFGGLREETSKKLDVLNGVISDPNSIREKTGSIQAIKDLETKKNDSTNTGSSTEKPIAYIRLFFLSGVYYLFNSRITFYFLLILIIIYILKYAFNKIRNM